MFKNVLKLEFLSVFPNLSSPERKISLAFPLLIANMGFAVTVGQHCVYNVVMVGIVWSTFIIFFANKVHEFSFQNAGEAGPYAHRLTTESLSVLIQFGKAPLSFHARIRFLNSDSCIFWFRIVHG